MAGVRITQDQRALPGRRYGSFAGKASGVTENFYKQMHHRMGRHHVTAETDVPQKYQKLG